MIRCIYDECQWPNCDKTCGLTPAEDYVLGDCKEEALIFHLQDEIKALSEKIDAIDKHLGSTLFLINQAYHSIPEKTTRYDKCAEVCKFGYGDCIYNPMYIKMTYPDWWVELGMPTECADCNDENCRYDDEDK